MTISEFEQLARQYSAELQSRCLRIVGDRSVAEDICQETLLRMWTIRDTLDKYRSPHALANVIATNLAINYLRDNRRYVSSDIDVVIESPELIGSIENEISARLTVNTLLSALPPRQAQLLRMRHLDGLELEEMSRVLQISNGALRTALSRARQAAASLFNK